MEYGIFLQKKNLPSNQQRGKMVTDPAYDKARKLMGPYIPFGSRERRTLSFRNKNIIYKMVTFTFHQNVHHFFIFQSELRK